MPRHARRVLVSAHRGGAHRRREVENTLAAFEAAIAAGADYIEFDIQRTVDGEFVLHHDDRVKINGSTVAIADLPAARVDALLGTRVRYADALALLARHGRKAHLDLKFTSPGSAYLNPESTYEVEVIEMALAHLPAADVIATTTVDASVRALRDWSEAHGIDLLVGLSIGRHRLTDLTWLRKAQWRWEELFPARRVRESRANLLVAHRLLARVRLLAWAHRHGLPVLVWTVDNPSELRRLTADPRVWMVTSNFPERALTC